MFYWAYYAASQIPVGYVLDHALAHAYSFMVVRLFCGSILPL